MPIFFPVRRPTWLLRTVIHHLVWQQLGDEEQADALHPGRGIGQAGQHQMDDVAASRDRPRR
jgi:hypothetical protein